MDMLTKIKKRLKKHTKIRKFVRTIINYTYRYVRNGYYKNMILYFLKLSKSEKHALQKFGFKDCRIYKTHFWRYNDGIDHVYRRYYSAYFNNKKVFIKICKNDSTAQNEIRISEYLTAFDMPFLTKAEAFSIDFNNGYSMLAIEFCADMKPFFIPKTIDAFSDYCIQFMKILDELSDARLIHADVHKNNLMVDCNDNLISNHIEIVSIDYV